MARSMNDVAVRQIQTLYQAGALGTRTDRELLEEFAAGPEAEAAFEVLVARHGPIVRATCRSLLADLHEADDAFQATFLVLARRAGSIRNKEAVASWLYGVAVRISLRARADATRRRTLSRYLIERAQRESTTAQPAREEMPELFEEVARLPERYRAPIVLCYLERQSHEQAARALGCPVATLQSRLLRAKARLRTRLARRGLVPAFGFLAAGAAGADATAAVAAALPVELAGSTARAAAQYAAAGGVEIKSSILAMTQNALKALLWIRLKHATLVSVGLAAGLIGAMIMLFAADKKAEKPVTAITGRITDTQGGPVAGAHVWLRPTLVDADQPAAEAVTDAQGQYNLAIPESWARLPEHERGRVVWAHAPGLQVATASAARALEGKAGAVDLTLGPATTTSFLVVGPDGRPVAGAVVEPFHLKTRATSYDIPPQSVLSATRGVTDAAGRAQLPALPREGLRAVQVTAENLGVQQLTLIDAASEPAERTVQLRPVGRIDGRVVASRPEWAAGIRLYATTEVDRLELGQRMTTGEAKVVTRADGSFTIPAIAAGKLTIAARTDQTLPVRPRLPERLEIQAGQATKAEIPLETGVRVSGVVRIRETRDPVAGAWIRVSYGAPRQSDTVVTNAQGQYTTHVLAGDVRMQMAMIPEGIVQLGEPWNERHHVPAGAATFDLPAIEVVRGVARSGRLVDTADRPVANVRVIGSAGNRRYAFAMTEANGEFTTNSVPSGIKLDFTVWVSDHEPPVDATIVTEQPLLLRAPIGSSVTKDMKSGLTGTVVEIDGRPVEGAKVTVFIEAEGAPRAGGMQSMSQRQVTLTTDAAGRFHLAEPIASGTRYRAIVTPGQFAIAASDARTADGTSPITLPPILVERLRSIAGRVLDSDGRPVVGATVLNWGNKAPLANAVTGPSGRFQLGSLPRGNAFLFVEAPGYRFHSLTPSPARSTVDIVIRRDDQPPERAIAALGPPITRDEAIDLAAKVIKPYSDRVLGPAGDAQARGRVVQVLAAIDPEAAGQKCQAGEAPWDSDFVRSMMVRRRATTSIEEADVIARTIKSDFWQMRARMDLIDGVPSARRDLRIRMLDELIRDARELANAGRRSYLLMESARRLIELDRGAQARELTTEALTAARGGDAAAGGLGATRSIIGTLARLDLKQAQALIPATGDERTINDFRGLIAQAIAATNPAEAERLIGQMTWNNSETYAVKACRRMAPVDLPRARRIAQALKSDVLRGYALGTMAGNLSADDRAAARQLLADSFIAFKQGVERGRGGVWGAQSAATMAAVLLPIVERIDPDHLAEAIERVVALRWFPRSIIDLTMTRPDTSNVESLRFGASLAALVSRYDHSLARSIAEPIINLLRVPLGDIENRYLDYYSVLPTLALADPRGTAALVEVIPDTKAAELGKSRDTARLIVAGALAAPESEFWTIIRRAVSDLEIVERED